MPPALPTYTEVTGLPAGGADTIIVPPEYEDENGHMNVRHYFDLGARAVARLFTLTGVDDHYRANVKEGWFTAEQHLTYYSEVHVGQRVSTRARLLDRSDKVIHAMGFVLNDTTESLASTFEVAVPYMDLVARRVTRMPEQISALVDAIIADTSRPWPAPVCGAMGVRRRVTPA